MRELSMWVQPAAAGEARRSRPGMSLPRKRRVRESPSRLRKKSHVSFLGTTRSALLSPIGHTSCIARPRGRLFPQPARGSEERALVALASKPTFAIAAAEADADCARPGVSKRSKRITMRYHRASNCSTFILAKFDPLVVGVRSRAGSRAPAASARPRSPSRFPSGFSAPLARARIRS